MFVLGLTGSLGMGKSTTAKFFAEAGVPVHDADEAVHRLYQGEAAPLVEAAFPGSTVGGKVDRNRLAEQVIGNPDNFKKLEALVHPLVRRAEERFLAENKDAEVVVLDIPLLYETGADRRCDAVVVVSAPVALQRERVLQRPGMSAERYDAIVAKQMADEEKRRRADFVVDSSKGFDDARRQVREVLAQVARMSKRST